MVDAVNSVMTILSADWTSANTDTITPVIGEIYSYKTLDLANYDYVLGYLVNVNHNRMGLGGNTFSYIATVSIDIRTTYKNAVPSAVRDHLIKLKDEVIRIMETNLSNPDSDFRLLLSSTSRDFSDRSRGMGRWILDINLERYT